MQRRHLALAVTALWGCDAPAPAALDAASDAPPVDRPSDDRAAPDAPPDTAPVGCAAPDASELLRALRAPRAPGVSVVAAPGMRFEDLRAGFDASADARALLEQARGTARAPVVTLALGDSATYQTVSSRALAAALIAWHDRDANAAQTALRGLAAAAVTPEWLNAAPEVPIHVGASLVAFAAAADLLSASTLPPADVEAARANLGRALGSVERWLQGGGLISLRYHTDNHGMRMGAGLVAAAMMAPESTVDDELLGYGLAQMEISMRRQTGGASGWAEGSTYYAYAFEVAAVALSAVDRAWTGEDTRCVRCPSHRIAVCGTEAVLLVRPSRDPVVRDLVRWGASLESRAGWLHPFDDSRFASVPAPLLERMVNFTTFSRWSIGGPTGSLGGSVNVGPLVALALATPAPAMREPSVPTWPAAGTARLDGATSNGAAMEVFVLGEHGAARDGAGHEHPDALGLTLVVDGALMLGASGYHTYDDRFAFARADASSVITVEGVLSRALGTGEAGPESALTAGDHGAVTSRFEADGVGVTRTVAIASGALEVRDRVEVTGLAREVAWHWHLRGALDPTRWAWAVGTRRCEVTQEGEGLTTARETAPHYDTYSRSETHPVIRQSARFAAGRHDVVTRVVCM